MGERFSRVLPPPNAPEVPQRLHHAPSPSLRAFPLDARSFLYMKLTMLLKFPCISAFSSYESPLSPLF